jgi:predicted GNAT superfamily acetyltransferase
MPAHHDSKPAPERPSGARSSASAIVIRDLVTIDDLNQLRAVEKQVWGMADDDALPLTLAIALQAAGNIFVGAFDKNELVGFAFGFLAREHSAPTLHSHMLAVLAGYRHLDLGARLKQAQRDRALAIGIQEMTWTFDPLQSRNAHFNFCKLGVVSDIYKVDFYGPETSSMLHRNGTDRLWVRWMLTSRRVRHRLERWSVPRTSGQEKCADALDALRLLAPLVRFEPSGKPASGRLAESLNRQRLSIEIPENILEVECADMALAREWREITRWAFREALSAGFFVADFCRSVRGQQGPGAYLLQRGDLDELASES